MLRVCAGDAGPRASLLLWLYSDMLATDGLSADQFEGNGRYNTLDCIASTDVPSELFGRRPRAGGSLWPLSPLSSPYCERELADPGPNIISDTLELGAS